MYIAGATQLTSTAHLSWSYAYVTVKRIDSPANPLVKELASLQGRRQREATGTFLVEGLREATRAMAAGQQVIRALHCPSLSSERAGSAELLSAVTAQGGELVELSPVAFAKLSQRQNPDGIALHVHIPPRAEAPLGGVTLGDDALVLVLDGIEKPGNLGALLRTADAVGVDLVIVCGSGTDLFNPNVIRASQGSVFAVRTVAVDDAEALAFLADRDVRLVATTPASTTPHWAADLTGRVAVLVGAESTGLREEWLQAAGELVQVPMHAAAADSLNASVAGAVVLYEALRQRSQRPGA